MCIRDRTYVKRVLLEDGSAVDVAAHRAESTELLLLAYRYTPAEFVKETALSIQSVLDGYPAETSGTLFIVQNNQVIAANRPELMGQDTADSPLVPVSYTHLDVYKRQGRSRWCGMCRSTKFKR